MGKHKRFGYYTKAAKAKRSAEYAERKHWAALRRLAPRRKYIKSGKYSSKSISERKAYVGLRNLFK